MAKGVEKVLTLDQRFQKPVRWFLSVCDELGLEPVVTEGRRSPERQAELYALGRTKPGEIVTKAKPGESAHQYGLAVDITSSAGYGSVQAQWIHALARSFGFTTIDWDEPHVEMPQWHRFV